MNGDSSARVEVAVARPAPGTFTYAVPERILVPGETTLPVGTRVEVPFGRTRLPGVVVGEGAKTIADSRLKAVLDRPADPLPALPPELVALARRLADQTVCPLGIVLQAMTPPGTSQGRELLCAGITAEGTARLGGADEAAPRLSTDDRRILTLLAVGRGDVPLVRIRRELELSPGRSFARLEREGLLRTARRRVAPDPEDSGAGPERSAAPELTEAQAKAAAEVREALDARVFRGFLLHGVTGSGKTEVYLDAVAAALEQGRGALVLVPEIALAFQMERVARARFGRELAVFHSGLSGGQRREAFWRVRRGEARVVLGARSAVFAPVRNLGIVVVDEEHDAAYAQEEAPRYHARRAAWLRAREAGAALLLGSATPSLEADRAAAGALTRLSLDRRIGARELAEVDLVDMRPLLREHARERRVPGPLVLSRGLEAALRTTAAAGQQALVLLNRRGYRARVLCLRCGEVAECERCALPLTLHRRGHLAVCHGCGRGAATPETCPECGGDVLRAEGIGTEKLHEAVAGLLPGVAVERFDRDTTRAVGERARMLDAFRRREIGVLVGTQMIAKGLDFPGVALVGVVAADAGLGIPDFRAAERTFQLLTQVAGRAGRGRTPGRAIVQTLNPEHYAVAAAASQDYRKFATTELALRERLGYPPFVRLTFITTTAPTLAAADEDARDLARFLADRFADRGVEVLGPAPAPPAPGRRVHRRRLVLKAPPQAHRILRRGLLRLLEDPVVARRTTIHPDP